MRHAKLITTSGYSWTTDVNGSDQSICEYFLGETFNVGAYPEERMEMVISCEIDGKAYRLLNQQRAIEIFNQCREKAAYGPWCDQIEKVMTPQEYQCLRGLWLCRPGWSTLAGTLCELKNGYVL